MIPRDVPAYTPQGRRLRADEMAELLADASPGYRANDTGMVYDVRMAQAIVAAVPRDPVVLFVANHPPDYELNAKWVLTRDIDLPGIVLFVISQQTGEPQYELLDGNHRVEKCRILGVPTFYAYPLTPTEAKACEWFAAPRPVVKPIIYRFFDDDGSEYRDRADIDRERSSGRR